MVLGLYHSLRNSLEGDMCKHSSSSSLASVGEVGKVLCVECHTKVDCPHPLESLQPLVDEDWQVCNICHKVFHTAFYNPGAALILH